MNVKVCQSRWLPRYWTSCAWAGPITKAPVAITTRANPARAVRASFSMAPHYIYFTGRCQGAFLDGATPARSGRRCRTRRVIVKILTFCGDGPNVEDATLNRHSRDGERERRVWGNKGSAGVKSG